MSEALLGQAVIGRCKSFKSPLFSGMGRIIGGLALLCLTQVTIGCPSFDKALSKPSPLTCQRTQDMPSGLRMEQYRGITPDCVPKGQTLVEAKKIAEKISETGPLALKAITKSLRDIQTDVKEADAMLLSDDLANPVFASADAKEGMRAFKEKRKANFTGE